DDDHAEESGGETGQDLAIYHVVLLLVFMAKIKRPHWSPQDSAAASYMSGQPARTGTDSELHRQSPQQIAIYLLHQLDVDDPPVADRQGQPAEPAFLQTRKDVQQERRLSVAYAAR